MQWQGEEGVGDQLITLASRAQGLSATKLTGINTSRSRMPAHGPAKPNLHARILSSEIPVDQHPHHHPSAIQGLDRDTSRHEGSVVCITDTSTYPLLSFTTDGTTLSAKDARRSHSSKELSVVYNYVRCCCEGKCVRSA